MVLLPDTTLPLTGRVVDEKGQPIEGAIVIARKLPIGQTAGMGFTDAGTRSTAPDGTFLFQRMSPDWGYRLEVNLPGQRLGSKTVQAKGGKFPPVEFKSRPRPPVRQ
jgi:hypothetical protein